MPDPQVPPFRMPEPTLRHLRIPNSPNRVDFAGRPGHGHPLRQVQRAQHSAYLRAQIHEVEEHLQAVQQQRIEQGLPEQVDLILELQSAPGFPLNADQIHSLTSSTDRAISLLNARQVIDENGLEATRVSLHVRYGSLSLLSEKVRRYGEETTDQGNVPSKWMANLQRIGIAALEALWTDLEPLPEDSNLHWWQLWVRRNPSTVVLDFNRLLQELEIREKGPRLMLPDHVIAMTQTTRAQLESSLDLLNTLAEVRKARPCSLGLTDVSGEEQQEWINEALDRIDFPGANAPAVCLLDTGVNRGHPLLSPLLSAQDNRTVFPDGDSSDSWVGSGHGTPMAGVAAFGDLRVLMLSTERWNQTHLLEGVKLIDPVLPHEPQNYGAITRQGIALPESVAANRIRVFAMAVTAEGPNDGRPTAWSAALDAAAFGAEEQREPKRLILVSAGNVDPFGLDHIFDYPSENRTNPIEDPAQAWNAITVGAITHRVQVQEGDPESQLLSPIAEAGCLSPYSRTASCWDEHWPIKPEIVMEGGNAGRHPEFGPQRRDSLELLSTSASIRLRPIAPIRATSAATALAARLAAQIRASYPDYWPETIRGLVVHSARWSNAMLEGIDPFSSYTREERTRFMQVLRSYGFGEPDSSRARFSSGQAVTLLREDTITPYRGAAGSATLNDCHIHRLQLPVALLRDHGSATCTMRVTLSYFAAPNPSSSNRIPGSRYRYGGCLLRFRVRHKDEDETAFERRVSRDAAEAEQQVGEPRNLNDQSWALGAKLRGKAGSIVQDAWQGSAADLAQMDRIAVFPVKGWWASRSFPNGTAWHRCQRRSIRYSLIASIEISADVPLYAEISNLIGVPIDLGT